MVSKKVKVSPLPKNVREKLRMACALRAYSSLKRGGGKKLRDQQESMVNFFHGQSKTHPSQIILLAEASYSYKDIFDLSVNPPTKKNKTKEDVRVHTLKKSISWDDSRDYICGYDIRVQDLEKNNRTGNQLVSGR